MGENRTPLVTLPVDWLCRSGLRQDELELLRACLLASDALGWVQIDEDLERFLKRRQRTLETLLVAGFLEIYPSCEAAERCELSGRLALGAQIVGPASHAEDFTVLGIEAIRQARRPQLELSEEVSSA